MMRLLLLSAALLPFASYAQTQMLRPFPDVPSTHPNYEAIIFLQANGVVQGNPDGRFQPDSNINRAEFTKILVESIADQNVIETCLESLSGRLFTDVRGDEWYAKYICVAKTYGMAQGNPDGSYRPNTPVNFAEASKFISTNFDLYRGSAGSGKTVWFKPYVLALVAESAVPVSITNFDEAITRGEMAEIMYRVQADIPPKPSLTYEQLETLTRSTRRQASAASTASKASSASATSKASAASQASGMSASAGG